MSTPYQRAIERMDAAARAVASDDPTKVFPMTHKNDSERLIEVADGVELTPIEFFAASPLAAEALESLLESRDKLIGFVAVARQADPDWKVLEDASIATALRLTSDNIAAFVEENDALDAAAAIRRAIGLQELAAANAKLDVVGTRNLTLVESARLAEGTLSLLRLVVEVFTAARSRALSKLAEAETRKLKSQIVDFLKRAAAGDHEHDIDTLDVHSIHRAYGEWIDTQAAGATGDQHHESLAAVLTHYFRRMTGKTVNQA